MINLEDKAKESNPKKGINGKEMESVTELVDGTADYLGPNQMLVAYGVAAVIDPFYKLTKRIMNYWNGR